MNQKILKAHILEIISGAESKITPGNLESIVAKKFPMPRKEVREAISTLVTEQELIYTYVYGSSYLEKSFNRPVQVSNHVVLTPAIANRDKVSGSVTIGLLHGASFGTGAHPTTRLAIRGIEFAIERFCEINRNEKMVALDIGTGSGVLAITAVMLGVHRADGIDTDACARVEAIENIKINRLSDKIHIHYQELDKINKSYQMVIANLRVPTLIEIASQVKQLVDKNGWVVVSGIREYEKERVVERYTNKGFLCKWSEKELGWWGLALLKTIED